MVIIFLAIITAVVWLIFAKHLRYDEALRMIRHGYGGSVEELRSIANAAHNPKNPFSTKVGK